MATQYTATAVSYGGRDGEVQSSDGVIDLQFSVPKELGGPGGAKANPEMLFAAGYAACFHGALKLVAGQQKLSMRDSTVTAKVGIGPDDAGGFALEVELVGSIPTVDRAKAEELMRAAHTVCPYSNATRNNIPVRLLVASGDAEPAAVS